MANEIKQLDETPAIVVYRMYVCTPYRVGRFGLTHPIQSLNGGKSRKYGNLGPS